MKDAELKKTRFYQEFYAEGHGEGREEGREEGRHGEALALVPRLLRRRLGPLPGGTEDRITTLSIDQIESLGEAMVDFARSAELTEWLRESG